jgi:hypothetical protein
VHDIYSPFQYPDRCGAALWSEQYILEALISASPRYEVVWATHLMARDHTELLRQAYGGGVAADDSTYGASFFFRIC